MKNIKHIKPTKKNKSSNPFTIQEGRIKEGKMGAVYRFDWAEDSYMPEAGRKETVGKSFNIDRLPLISLVLLFFIFILLAKTAWLQVIKGDYYYSMAEGNRIRAERIEPKRGVIYDRNGQPLVMNKANFLLYFIPADIFASSKLMENQEIIEDEFSVLEIPADQAKKNDQQFQYIKEQKIKHNSDIINRISEILGDMSSSEIKEKLDRIEKYSLESYQPLFIVDNIEYEKAMLLYLESANWPGVILSNKTKREYFNPYLSAPEEKKQFSYSMSHILGYIGKINEEELMQFGQEYLPIDYIGKMGIEYFWENELKGKSGKKNIEVDALGKEKKIIGQEDAEDGHNLVLSLDTAQQVKLEEILLSHLSKIKLNRASAIIMDPRNGEILAMVSLPAYNNNVFARGITQEEYNILISHPDHPLFNRSISGEYPSGSTIKPVMAAAAMEEKIISEFTTIRSTGGIKIGQWFFPDWLPGGHGAVDIRRAIAESINTFFYYIGGGYEDFQGLGLERIVEYDKLFGLSSQTGIDLAGERGGFLPTREWKEEVKGERWYIGDTYHLSIGQGDLLVTPLQVAAFTGVFANGGALYRPHFVKEILAGDDQVIKTVEIEPVRQNFIEPYNIHVVRQGLRQAVISGSARRLQSLPVAAAGKTGTAQWSSKNDPHAWFTGFAPYDNPELVITILVERAGEGSDIAVPIAQEFLEWYFGEYKLDIK